MGPDDPRNVDIDSIQKPPRGISWVQRLAGRIELASKPVQLLVTGLPGSGKSTELRRLVKRLETPGQAGGANFLVVWIDAEECLDLATPIDIPDIFLVMLLEAERHVLRAEGAHDDELMRVNLFERLWTWLRDTDVELGKAQFSIPGAFSLTAEMKSRPSLRERVRSTVANHLTSFLKIVRDDLEILDERARKLRAGLMLIVDSLEKLHGITSNYEQVLKSAEQVFGGGAPYLRLPVHSIFTVPAALTTRQTVQVEFMPMVKLHERSGAISEPGFKAMRELIQRRVPDAALQEILGPAHESRVRRIIDRSGGYPREIVKALQWLLEIQQFPVKDEDLERAENETRERFRAVVLREDFAWLARLAREQTLTVESEEHRQTVDRVLMNNVVMRYCNTDIWYGLHPAVSEIAGIREAGERLERSADLEDARAIAGSRRP